MSYTRRRATRALRVYWILLLLVGEIGLYQWHIGGCKWPTKDPAAPNEPRPTTVAIIADPQIVDHYSYNQTGLLLRTVEFFTDIYMRKSYRFLQTIRRPSHVIFLGDLMDGGREWDDDQWATEYLRYRSIFTTRYPQNTRVYDMAGNHDIGIGNTVVKSALKRFHRRVGPTNFVIEDIGGHDIVLLDTLTLESDDPEVSHDSRSLVERLADGLTSHPRPRLLFTHVPMRRPAQTYCGPERQSAHKYLPDRTGYQFRDQLLQNTTEYLLKNIRPRAVFSGDDHDSCTVEHPIDPNKPSERSVATEYTIGAFGWASGVPIASYALLTLYPGSPATAAQPTYHVQRCFLPYQLGIYKFYIASFVATLIIVAAVCYSGSHSWHPAAVCRLDGSEDEQHLINRSAANNSSGLPLPAGMQQGRWSFSKRGCLLQMIYILRDLFVVGLPTYIACILFFYIF
ncbi:hypothetical protein GGI15_002557 [Coemansia interrupta]|uniref:Calcineurin-like phosphoesterase domain-containing protein n=1 Tax=Coemansia interrupta TaxID=1126814 RepID=A0A9W8HKS9_9FUNG|nr:hypothetical protein GGI15_002557 [Coemansia interrupta]